MNSELTVGLVQQRCSENRELNIKGSVFGIRRAAEEGADLVVLPELHPFAYFSQTVDVRKFNLAEPVPGPLCESLGNLARELAIVIVGSVFERRASRIYHDTAVVLDRNGSLAGCYRKMHIPSDPRLNERFYFTPGDKGFIPIETQLGKLGVLVGWDQWFPEAARLMALRGAELLIFLSAIGWNSDDDLDSKDRELDAWITIHKSHAVANGIPVLACNRTGLEAPIKPGITFWGSSLIIGHAGQVIGQADTGESEVLTAKIDLNTGENSRLSWAYFKDRRIDEYSGLLKRYID